MKKTLLTLITGFCILLASCGHPTLNSKDDAVKFLESHNFWEESATITGSGGGKINSSFSIQFANGNAQIGEESIPYTIGELKNGRPGHAYFNGYEIQICGSQKYAYGGCIKCYLSSGIKSNGDKEEDGSSLLVDGTFVHAYFSHISKNEITNKN